MGCQASNPRDKLYSLISIAKDFEVSVAYKEEVKDIYRDFAIKHIRSSGTLDILGFAMENSRPDRVKDLPSWVPDWTNTAAPKPLPKQHWEEIFGDQVPEYHNRSTELPGTYTQRIGDALGLLNARISDTTPRVNICNPVYAASKSLQTKFDFSDDGRKLHVRGLIFDHITRALDRVTSNKPHRRQLFPEDIDPQQPYIWTDETFLEAFRHTICADVDEREFGYSGHRGASIKWPSDNDWLKAWFGKMSFDTNGLPIAHSAENLVAGAPHINILVRWVRSRTIFQTSRGFIGLGQKNARPGDAVHIVAGSQVPLVMRPRGECFEYIGECYVHGIMDGEAAINREHELEDLILD